MKYCEILWLNKNINLKESIIVKFKEAFVILAPGVDPAKDRSFIDTPKYACYTVLVQNPDQALAECKKLTEQEGVRAISLCPGFSNSAVGMITEAVGPSIGVCVARPDVPGGKIIGECIVNAGW